MARPPRAIGLALALLLATVVPVLGAGPAVSMPALPRDPLLPPVVDPITPPPVECRTPYLGPPSLNVERRASLARRLDRLRGRFHVPGISVAIAFPDGTFWSGTSGWADVAAAVPLESDTAFAVASISKTFTAALILALRDAGRIDLEAAAAAYLPELALDASITVRQLLDHTSGLHDFFLGPKIDEALLDDRARDWTPHESLSYVGEPYFKPGKGWHYSNTNYLILGLIAERVDGRPLMEQLRERFFDPLGLARTYEQIGEAPRGPVAHGYRLRTADDDAPVDLSDGTSRVPFSSVVTAAGAAGSLASTPTDLVRWARALYTGDVLSPSSLQAMVADASAGPSSRAPVPYGLGVQVLLVDGRITLGHSGRLLGFRSWMRWFPDDRVAIAVSTNQSRVDPAVITRSLLRLARTPVARCTGRAVPL